MSDDGSFWTGVFITAALAGGLYYCTREDKPSPAPPIVPTYAIDAAGGATTETVSAPVEPPAPEPNYDEKDGTTYYYVAVVSEEEQKQGKSSGFVSSYQYGGKDDSGAHIVFGAGARYTCSVPCKIIKSSDGARHAYNGRSIISAVFEDAMKGFLKTPPKPKPKPVDEVFYESAPVAPEVTESAPVASPAGATAIEDSAETTQ